MLIDASVARSFAVIGWTRHLVQVTGGTILLADGVHGREPDDASELRNIRAALQRRVDQAGLGSGHASRALAAIAGLDELLTLQPPELSVLSLTEYEFELAVRLQSRRPDDRAWRHSLGARSRRLDGGESASIAIASSRALAFASDDEDALILWQALTATPPRRTRDLFWQLVTEGAVPERDAQAMYDMFQADDLHNLGGPSWIATQQPHLANSSDA
jgi:hypothetical protein